MNRRSFLLSLGALGAAGSLVRAKGASGGGDGAAEKGGFPLYVQLRSQDVVDVRWRSARPVVGRVRWTQEAGAPAQAWREARQVQDGMVCANTCEQVVTLRGVDPTKPLWIEAYAKPIRTLQPYKIVYEAEEEVGACEVKPLLAGAEGRLSLAVMSDVHGNTGLVRSFLATEAVRAAAPSVLLFNGDCVDDCGTQAQVEARFLHLLPELSAGGLQTLFLRGNHEYRGAMARRLRENFSPLANGRFYGAFDLGPVRLLVIDSGEDKPDDSAVYGGLLDTDAYLREEAAWLREEIASSAWQSAPWRVAVMHIPPFCADQKDDAWYGPIRLRREIEPLLKEAGLHALICGHNHQYKHLAPAERPYDTFIVGGPYGPASSVLLLEATATRLRLQAHGLSGAHQEVLELQKGVANNG